LRLGANLADALTSISADYCARVDAGLEKRDWRYYLVKYDIMRSGASGAYVAESFDGGQTRVLGFSLCMLNTTTLGGYFRDPYLAAMRKLSGVQDKVADPRYIDQYENHPRWMALHVSGAALRCVSGGIALRMPEDPALAQRFQRICEEFGADEAGVIRTVEQSTGFDAIDRVALGARLLHALVSAGL
jgi:hypothetical protein